MKICQLMRWLFCVILFAACVPPLETETDALSTRVSGTLTAAPSPTVRFTSTPIPSPTSTPIPTPTLIPLALVSSPVPGALETINAENAFRLQEVARWGIGELIGIRQSPDGQQIALFFSQGVLFFSGQDYSCMAAIHTPFEVNFAAFASDDSRMVFASAAGDVWVLDRADQRILQTFLQPHAIGALAISPTGDQVAIASDWDAVYLQPSQGGLPKALPQTSGPVYSLAFSPDGHLLAIGYAYGKIELWDIGAERKSQEIDAEWEVEDLAFSPDSTQLAATVRGALVIWNVSDASVWTSISFRESQELYLHGAYSFFAISRDWKKAAILHDSEGRTSLRVASLPDGELLHEIELDEEKTAYFIGFTLQEDGLFTIIGKPNYVAGDIHQVDAVVWNLANSSSLTHWTLTPQVTSLRVSPQGDFLAVGMSGGQVFLHEASTGRAIRVFAGRHEQAVKDLRFMEDGKKLVSIADGGNIVRYIRDVISGLVLETISAPELSKEGYTFKYFLSPDAESVIIVPEDTTFQIRKTGHYSQWNDSTSGEVLMTLKIQQKPLESGEMVVNGAPTTDIAAVSYSGQFVIGHSSITVAESGYYLWFKDNEMGKRVIEGSRFGDKPDLLIFSPDDRWLGAAVHHVVKIWGVDTWQGVTEITVPETITALAFSPDGNLVATASEDGIVRLWQVSDGSLVIGITPLKLNHLPQAHNGNQAIYIISALDFSPDMTRLYAGDNTGMVHIFAIAP